MIRYHDISDGIRVAEITTESEMINNPQDMLDIMADIGYGGCNNIILHKQVLPQDFFDLKTGLAGEILQKFSNYRMRLSIIGDYSQITSRSLKDFIRESNKGKTINFVESFDMAIRNFSAK
jgi:hypothetical protein